MAIDAAMREMGWSQEKLAHALGVTQPTVSRMFTKERPKRDHRNLRKAARREMERRLAHHRIHALVQAGRALQIPPCTGHTMRDLPTFLEHMERCPACLYRSYRHITQREQ